MKTTRRGFLAVLGLGALAAKATHGGTAEAKADPVPEPRSTEWVRDGWREPTGGPRPATMLGYAVTGSTANGVVTVALGESGPYGAGQYVRCECRSPVFMGDLVVIDAGGQVASVV